MPDEVTLARGWFLKAESDLLTAERMAELSSYAIAVRYDFEFWPDRASAHTAVELASEVRNLVLAAVPEASRP